MENRNNTNQREPIAIVGIGCRFPGGIDSPERFFEALLNGFDGISDVPKDRWDIDYYYDPDPNVAGKVKTRKGGFLKDWDKFDAEFFGYFPSVANKIDPQQRLILMAAYEAMEDAGLTMDELSGSRVAVYGGDFIHDNYSTQTDSVSYRDIGSHSVMGTSPASTAGRISDRFNFRGPAVSLDTACSSSLVATQLGLQAIWSGNAEYAMVGGVNVMTNPASYLMLSKGNFLSPDGYCKSFDASGNGYVRGEACGVVMLMPLSEAERRGCDIYAVIKGAYVNHDGYTEEGFTVPNGDSQVEMLKYAYQDAGINPAEVDYMEAHGTGTVVGDPIETGSFGQVFAEGRDPNKPLLIGSVKSNIGHTEAGAGIAGLIKLALAMKNRKLPKNLHFKTPNPKIKWDEWKLKVVDENREWPDTGGRPVRGGVNSFGASGTNAHVILEEYIPSGQQNTSVGNGQEESRYEFPMVFNLSAKSEAALKGLASRYAEFVNESDDSLVDICASVAKYRSKMDVQLAIIAHSKEELAQGLTAYAGGEDFEGLITGTKADEPLKVAFVCSGQGPQWYAMGRQLMETSAVFRKTVEDIDGIFNRLSGYSLWEEMNRPVDETRIGETRIAQPAIMAVQIGLIHMWKEFGVEPQGLVGHSIGEVAAAYGSGALTLEQAVDVIYNRSKEQDRASGAGVMLAVGQTLADAMKEIRGVEDRVSVAAINGPEMLTLAGDKEPIEEIAERLEKKEVFNKFLRVSVPFHSHHMEPLKEDLLAGLAHMTPGKAKIPLYSTVTGQQEDGTHLVSEYWYKNVRDTVYFTAAVEEMILDGYNVFVEIAPHPVLGGSVNDMLASMKKKGYIITSARRDIKKFEGGIRYEEVTFLTGAAKLAQLGVDLSWDVLFEGKGAKRIKLPRYAWQLEAYWEESAEARKTRMGDANAHPTLMKAQLAPDGSDRAFFDLDFDRREKRWLNDHVVDGVIVVPGTAHVEVAYRAAKLAYGDKFSHLEDIHFDSAFILPDEENELLDVKLEITSEEGDYALFSRGREEDQEWSEHSGGRMNYLDHDYVPVADVDLKAIQGRVGEELNVASFYADLKKVGLVYGEDFQLIKDIRKNDDELLAKIELNDRLAYRAGAYDIHPAMMDACLHAIFGAVKEYDGKRGNYLPNHFGRVKIFAKPESTVYSYVRMLRNDRKFMIADFVILNPDGTLVAEIQNGSCKYVEGSRGESANDVYQGSYVYEWEEADPTVLAETKPAKTVGVGKVLVFGDQGGVIGQAMGSVGATTELKVTKGDGYGQDGNSFTVNTASEEDFKQLIAAASEGGPVQKVVFGWALDTSFDANTSAASIDEQTTELADAGVNLVKALGESDYAGEIYFVTNGVNRVSDEADVNFGQGAAVGIYRVLVNEYSSMQVRAIDLSADKSEVAALAKEIAEYGSQFNQVEVALRGDTRYNYVIREWTAQKAADQTRKTVEADGKSFIYDVTEKGVLDSLVFREHSVGDVASDDVVVAVKSAGVNFKDTLNALGILEYESVKGGVTENRLGTEVSGVVVSVGAGVTDFKPGDEVVGRVPYGVAGTTKTKDYMLQPKPAHLSFAEAASNTVVFKTAYYGLMHMARMEEGERVLIHSAAGGVGLAAIQLANLVGAEVYATVGSEEKVNYLKGLGIKHIYNSRSTDFYSEIMRDTNGEGVDIVLNSLTGKAITQSFKALRPFGRFVEIGKADIYKNAHIGLKRLGENLSYYVVDIDRLLAQKPKLGARMLKEVTDLFVEKKCTPLPIKSYPVAQTVDALRYLGKGTHIGKVVISMEGEVDLLPAKSLTFSSDATYMISGGASGLGLQYAKFLADRGAKHLVLLSRSGVKKVKDQAMVDAIIAMGVNVALPKVDIMDEARLKEVVAEVNGSMPAIKGIIHSAGILDDAAFPQMNTERWKKVYLPKVVGAWNLHNATLGSELDFFLNISSVSAFVGLAGQSNYSAANSTLDRLSMYRQAKGLAGCSINLGVLGTYAGMSELNDETRKYLEILSRQGFEVMPLEVVLNKTERVIVEQTPYRHESITKWAQFGEFFSNLQKDSRFEPVLEEARQGQGGAGQGGNSLKDQVLNHAEDARQEFLQDQLQEALVKILGTSKDKIPVDKSISKMGLDSLMINQLRNWIQSNLEINFPLMRIAKGPALTELASQVLADISSEAANEAAAATGVDTSGIADDDDIEVLADNWLVRNKKGPKAPKVRVFMQHSIGASASMFVDFLAKPDADIDFVAIQWPGREHRATEEPIQDTVTLIDKVTEAIESMTDVPFVLWGHSFGGIVMYEVARRLKAKGVTPLQFIDTATIAPHITAKWKDNGLMQDEAVDGLDKKDGDEVWSHIMSIMDSLDTSTPEHKAVVVEIAKKMQMDNPLLMGYDYVGAAVMDCPLVVYASPEDEVVSIDDAREWNEHTSAEFTLVEVKGDHWFVTRQDVRETIRKDLMTFLQGKGVVSGEKVGA